MVLGLDLSKISEEYLLFEVAYTYNAMNPISRIGYTFMLKRNHALVERAGEVKKSIDSMSGE